MTPLSIYGRFISHVNTPLIRITLILVIGLIVISIMYATLPLWHEQTINLNRVGQWKVEVSDQVAAFEKEI